MGSNPFTEARQFLWLGNTSDAKKFEKYLCHAIMRASDAGLIADIDCYTAARMIHSRLNGYKFIEAWLCNELGLSLAIMTPLNVQSYRFLWLGELERLWNQGERT